MLIIFGLLSRWPTLAALAMFPVLVVIYTRLACIEERKALAQVRLNYQWYMRDVPALIPRLCDLIGSPKHGPAGRG